MILLTPPSVTVIDGYIFSRELLNCFFNRDRIIDQIRLQDELPDFSLLTNEKIHASPPHFILFNYQSCLQDYKKHLKHIRNQFPKIKFIAYFFLGNDFEIDLLLKAGVNAIIGKCHPLSELFQAIDKLATQEHYCNNLITKEKLLKSKRMLHIEDAGLTLFEIAVMRFVSIGLPRETIATMLGREKHTIEKDISSIHSKTGTKNDMQILRYAILHGHVNYSLLQDGVSHPIVSDTGRNDYKKVEI